MNIRGTVLAAWVLCCAAVAASGAVSRPTKVPAQLNKAQLAALRAGIELGSQGRYKEAVAKYEAVLRESPDAAQAMVEASLALCSDKQYDRALEYALRGMNYKSPWLGRLYALAGECYDQTSRPAEALPYLQAAIAQEPGGFASYHELGLAFMALGRLDEARESLKAAIALKPEFPQSHYALGTTLLAQGAKVPALLAFFRYLVLDPDSEASRDALLRVGQILDEIDSGRALTDGPTAGKAKAPAESEGDYAAAVGAASVAWKTAQEDPKVGNWDRVSLTVAALLERLGREDAEWRETFTGKLYVPYFAQIVGGQMVEPFCAVLFQSGRHEAVTTYIASNPEKVAAFLKWSKDYKWPRLKAGLMDPAKSKSAKGSARQGSPKASGGSEAKKRTGKPSAK